MKPESKKLCFLLGANTSQGFVSRFDQLIKAEPGWRTYIIKGGPGSGKSTMMKKIAREFDEDPGLELIICSSNADSLDAVIVPSKKFCIADGTAPHVLEPRYPGAVESLVDLSACWNQKMLRERREDIVSLTDRCSKCHEYCCRFLAAAGSLTGDCYRFAMDCVNMPKLAGYLDRLAEKEFKPRGGQGKEKVRFLTAITDKGIVKHADTAKLLAQRVYFINDEYGAVSRIMLHNIRSKALAAGYDIISCYCPLSPFEKLEQIFVPELSLGFMTSNRFHNFDMEISPYRIINCQRFTDNQKLKEGKKRMSLGRKATAQMVEQARSLLHEAKTVHDELEGHYIAATDFSKVDSLTGRLLEEMKN